MIIEVEGTKHEQKRYLEHCLRGIKNGSTACVGGMYSYYMLKPTQEQLRQSLKNTTDHE